MKTANLIFNHSPELSEDSNYNVLIDHMDEVCTKDEYGNLGIYKRKVFQVNKIDEPLFLLRLKEKVVLRNKRFEPFLNKGRSYNVLAECRNQICIINDLGHLGIYEKNVFDA